MSNANVLEILKEIEKMLNEIKERPHRSKFKQLWDTYHGDNSK